MYYKISGLTRGLRGYYNKWETQKAMLAGIKMPVEWRIICINCIIYGWCLRYFVWFIMSAVWHMRALHHLLLRVLPVTAVFFAGIFAVRYAQNKGILILPMWINVLAAAGLLILISSFCLVQVLITVQMKQKPEPDCEYLLILGCRVRGL